MRSPTDRVDCNDWEPTPDHHPGIHLEPKRLPPSAESKRLLVEEGHAELSIRRQCELLGLSRASFYYEPTGVSAGDLRLMRLIDEQSTACPSYGSRRVVV
jgi:putative transposase